MKIYRYYITLLLGAIITGFALYGFALVNVLGLPYEKTQGVLKKIECGKSGHPILYVLTKDQKLVEFERDGYACHLFKPVVKEMFKDVEVGHLGKQVNWVKVGDRRVFYSEPHLKNIGALMLLVLGGGFLHSSYLIRKELKG